MAERTPGLTIKRKHPAALKIEEKKVRELAVNYKHPVRGESAHVVLSRRKGNMCDPPHILLRA